MPPRKPARARSDRTGTRRAPARKAPARKPQATGSRVCSRCGRTEACAPGGIPAGWSVAFAGGRVEYLCTSCARANIRAIEGKLPEEYWE